MEIKAKIKRPVMPSHIFVEQAIGKRQDGFKPSLGKVAISDLTVEQAHEYAELMKRTFIDHWKNGGKNKR